MSKTIVAGIDFSDVTEDVLSEAKRLAALHGAEVELLHVVRIKTGVIGFDAGPEYLETRIAGQLAKEGAELQHCLDSFNGNGTRVSANLRSGNVAEQVLAESRALDASLIVLGCHGHGRLDHLLCGSVSEAVIRRAHCPVVVIHKPNAN
jgi:nucleotide-binding universal stress UspA family protein